MKKSTPGTILLGLLLVVTLHSCTSTISSNKILGKWNVFDVEIDMQYPEDEKKAMENGFIGAYFLFEQEGAFEHKTGNTTAKGTWSLEDDILSMKTINVGSEFTLKYSISSVDEKEMIMKREYANGSGIVFKMKKVQQ